MENGAEKTAAEKFNDSLKVEKKPKQLTAHEIFFQHLEEKGIDKRLLKNPRFVSHIIRHITDLTKSLHPGEKITVDQVIDTFDANFEVRKFDNGIGYRREVEKDGKLNIQYENYFMDGENYVKTNALDSMPNHDRGGEATKRITRSTYDKDGIEIKKEFIQGRNTNYSYTYKRIEDGCKWDKLTLTRKDGDRMICDMERWGITPYNNTTRIYFTSTLDNECPEDLNISDDKRDEVFSARTLDDINNIKNKYNQSDLFTNPDRKEEKKQYQKSFLDGTKKSKFFRQLNTMLSKQPEYKEHLGLESEGR